MDIYNLSTPAYLYLIIALIVNVLALFILPFNCSSIGLIACMVILLLSILLTLIFIYLVSWAIDALYQSGYTVLSWILAIVVILFSLIDLGSIVGNMPSVSSSSSNVYTPDESNKTTTSTGTTSTGTTSSTSGSTSTNGNTSTSGFTDNALDIYSNPTGSYLGR